MTRTATLLKFTALPGQRDAVVATFQDEATRLSGEPGILLYLVHTAPDEPDAVWLYVAFASERDEEAYTRGVAGERAMNRTDAFAPLPPEHIGLVPVGGKGMPNA